MQGKSIRFRVVALTITAMFMLTACGGGGRTGAAITATAQTLAFVAAPAQLPLYGSAVVSAKASSGLAVGFSSLTPAICSVDASSGLVTDLAPGLCTIAADQSGNDVYAPATQATLSIPTIHNPVSQSIRFEQAPSVLALYGSIFVRATASSGLPVHFGSTTPAVCAVSSSGLVSSLAPGHCVVTADQAGDASYGAATQVTQVFEIPVLSCPISVPGTPVEVQASLGDDAHTVQLSFVGPAFSGGSPITGYTVTSVPAGLTASGPASPLTVVCPTGCGGYAFSVAASNAAGNGAPSASVDVITAYSVITTFFEPDTQPQNSIFTGSFLLNSTRATVSGLQGQLTESMTGPPMQQLPLRYQLSAIRDGAGGLLVTSFLLNTTATFSTNPAHGGTDGWAPNTGSGFYYGFPHATNPMGGGTGNAYVRIYVNTQNPTAALTPAQINKLAYADCTAGGMMGDTCMTGTAIAGYGALGTMGGYPVSQTIRKELRPSSSY